MSSFYGADNNNNNNNAGGGSGFYNSSDPSMNFGGQQQQQPQQQQQQQQYQQQSQPYGFQPSSMQQWQQPSESMQSMNPQQQQNPYQQGAPAFWNQNTTAAIAGFAAQAATGGISKDNMIDWAMKGSSTVWKSGSASVIPGLDATMHMLRGYFAVDNRYVKRKMQRILFPFQTKQWKRIQNDHHGNSSDEVQYGLPHSDDNAPDLYLPSMSLITYCLLCALCYGTAGNFNPEVIPDVTTKCFVTQILEVLIIRFGFYMMQAPVNILDLFSYTGYKYLGLSINMLAGLTFGHLGYGTPAFYGTFLWTASAASYFMLKTMANNIPVETAETGPKREVMVLAFAGSQALSMWFVSQTQHL